MCIVLLSCRVVISRVDVTAAICVVVVVYAGVVGIYAVAVVVMFAGVDG